MDRDQERRRLARLAVLVAAAAAAGDEDADGLLVDAFSSLDEAARSHAYLSGWVLQLLAQHRGQDMASTLAYVRNTLA